MGFDKTDAADKLVLKNEVNNDPLGMGYLVSGNTDKLLDLLNNSAKNLSPVDGSAPMTARNLLDIVLSETIGSTVQFKIQLIFEATGGLISDLSEFKAAVSGLDSGLSAKIALLVRPLSRAEALFSVDDLNGVKEFTTITKADWIAARDS